PLALAGLEAGLSSMLGLRISAWRTPLEDLPATIASHAPDVILWDLGQDARAMLDRLRELRLAPVPVLVLSPPDDALAKDAFEAGARGVLPRTTPLDRIEAALRALAAGLVAFDEGFGVLLETLRLAAVRAEAPDDLLTAR